MQLGTVEQYLQKGPEFIFLFHPDLGPLWSIIAQKIRGGRILRGSELVLEIAEARIVNLHLSGSLIVCADQTLGHNGDAATEEQNLIFSSRVGRIQLENVCVENAGIEWDHHKNVYWKHEVYREAFCMIQLHGRSEFSAKDITIQGHHVFEVPDGRRLSLIPDPSISTGFREELTELSDSKPTWEWKYHYAQDEVVELTYQENRRQ